MAVYSFSVKPTHIDGILLVQKAKKYSIKHGMDFSTIMLEALQLWEAQNVEQRRNKD